MPNFSYKAKNKNGETITGEMVAVSEGAVGETLIQSGVFPFMIEEQTEEQKKEKGISSKKVNVITLTRQLYTLVRSGIPISKALKSLEVSNSEPELRELFRDIRSSLDNGYELYVALQKHSQIFNKFYVNMVRIGELTGRLEEVLLELYDFLQFEADMKKRAKTAIRYPIFILSVMAVAFTVMMVFVIPTFGQIYSGFNANLPWPTRVLMATSSFMISYGLIILVGIVFGIKSFLNYIKTEAGDMWWSEFKFKLPIIGKTLKKSVLARFSKGFSLSLKSGIPILQGLSAVQYILENSFVEKHVEDIKHSIERGNTLYGSMKNTEVFDSLTLEMMATGEESGELEAMCDEISHFYDEEITHELNNLSAYIEPIMLLILGGLLLILALGVFLPIWDLGSVVMKK
jgi:MSHA biogenesis protein MshG